MDENSEKTMKKILATGGAGFIRTYLVDTLIEKSHEVIVMDNLSIEKRENINKKKKFYKIVICFPIDVFYKNYQAFRGKCLSKEISVLNSFL